MTYRRGLHPTYGRRAFPHDAYAGDPSHWNGTLLQQHLEVSSDSLTRPADGHPAAYDWMSRDLMRLLAV